MEVKEIEPTRVQTITRHKSARQVKRYPVLYQRMKMKKTVLFPLWLALFLNLTGCTYLGHHVNINPVETASWRPLYSSNDKFPRLAYDCNNFTVEAEFIPVNSTVYAIGFLLPIFPIYSHNLLVSNENDLTLSLILNGDISSVSFKESNLRLSTPDNLPIPPKSIKINYGQPRQRQYYEISFPVVPTTVTAFTLIFPGPIGGCLIPEVSYKRDDSGLSFGVIGN